MTHPEIEGEISAEVFDTICELMADVIGRKGVEIILRQTREIHGKAAGPELLFALANQAQDMLGTKGGFATHRLIGHSLARGLMKQYPRDQWQHVLETALNVFGFARRIETRDNEASICDCVFYAGLHESGLGPVQHSVCWAGVGFIEGFMAPLQNATSIRWVRRNHERNCCDFELVRRDGLPKSS